MTIITKELDKEKLDNNYTAVFVSGQIERVERVLVDTIPLATYFDNDMMTFCSTYSSKGTINIEFDIDITEANMEILSREYIYESDKKKLSERAPKCDDVVLFYVNIKVPVENTYEESYQGYYHMDFNPTAGHKHTIAQNGFHRWVPIDIDSEPGNIEEIDNRELLAKHVNVYMRPIRIQDLSGKKVEGTDKIQTIYHTDEEHWFDPKDAKFDPTMLRLGKVIVHANSNINDNLTILDTRTRGGGLDESLSKEIIKKINSESMYHWDIGYFDGEAYQENGVMIIKLPNTLLNTFSETEIQAAVAKHKAYGNLPIIEYYNPDDITNSRFGILTNFEFNGGEHLSYYDPELTTTAQIVHDNSFGTGDDYVLELKDNNVYGITIPGHVVADMEGLRVDVKSYRNVNDAIRKAGTITVLYENGTKDIINLLPLTHAGLWQVIEGTVTFNPDVPVERVQLVLNDSALTTRGRMLIDYVEVKAYQDFDKSNAEIHEI